MSGSGRRSLIEDVQGGIERGYEGLCHLFSTVAGETDAGRVISRNNATIAARRRDLTTEQNNLKKYAKDLKKARLKKRNGEAKQAKISMTASMAKISMINREINGMMRINVQLQNAKSATDVARRLREANDALESLDIENVIEDAGEDLYQFDMNNESIEHLVNLFDNRLNMEDLESENSDEEHDNELGEFLNLLDSTESSERTEESDSEEEVAVKKEPEKVNREERKKAELFNLIMEGVSKQ